MADGRKVQVIVDVVQGKAGGKKAIDDLEKDVIASQKRITANSKATDRAILTSQQATVNAAKAASKQKANDFLSALKQMETGAKTSSKNIRSSLESAFGGGLIGGALGGFAGGLFGSITAQMAQLPAFFKTQVDEMVRIASERQNAFKGLESVALFKGISAGATQDAVKNLRLVRSGVVDVTEATIALKNLLQTNFSLPEAIKLLEAFSDTAAFGKSAALGFGEAIRGATEGIRNGNSILVDNVGLTKNLSQILKDAGHSEKDLMLVQSDLNVRTALYNGLLKEAQANIGDADKLTQGWTGNTAALTTAQNNLYAAIGDVIIRNEDLNALVKTLTGDLNDLTKQVGDTESGWSKAIDSMTSSFAKFVLDFRTGINKEIADVKELINVIDVAASGIATLLYATNPLILADAAAKNIGLDTGLSNPMLETYGRFQRGKSAIGSEYKKATDEELRLRNEFNKNLRQQVAPTTSPFGPGASIFATPFGPNNVAFPGMLGTTNKLKVGDGDSKEAAKIRQQITDLEKLKLTASGKELKTIEAQLAKRKKILEYLDSGVGIAAARAAASGGGSRGKVADKLPEFGSMRQLVISSGNAQWDSWFNQMGSKFGVDPNVLMLQAGAESSFKAGAVSPKGAKGFSQFMPGTAARFKVDTGSVKDSIRGQAEYMSLLLSMFGGDYRKALAGYNAGEGAVQKYGGIPPYRETRGYVAKIQAGYRSRVRGGGGRGFGTFDFPDEMGLASESGISSDIDLNKFEKQIEHNEMLAKLYKDVADALFEMNENTEEQIFLRDVQMGQYPGLTEGETELLAAGKRSIDQARAQKKADEEAAEAKKQAEDAVLDTIKKQQEEQQRLFEDTQYFFEDVLTDLAQGNFKNIWKRLRDDMLEQFIRPASQYLAQLFTGQGMSMGGSGGGLLGGLFGGGGGMGPGGTPNFNPAMGFAGGGSQGGGMFGGLLGNLFGGGRSGGGAVSYQGPGISNTIGLRGGGMFTAPGGAGGGLGGMLRGMGGGSMMAGIGSGLGMAGMLAGSAIGGRLGNFLSMTGMGASIGANFGPWGALIGAGGGALVGLISSLFGGGDKSNKQIKEAALAAYGITLKDKSVINTIKQIGEQYFGKGKAGANATQLMQVDEVKNILRNYAQMSGQNGEKIDLLSHTDPNWSGNQFKSKFGGFRAMGGPVQHGYSYIVGERGPEVFRPQTNGSIDPTVGGSGLSIKMVAALADAIYELKDEVAQFKTMSPDAVVMKGAYGAREAVYDAGIQYKSEGGRATETDERASGRYR